MAWYTGQITTNVGFIDLLKEIASNRFVLSATVAAGGTGYAVGNTLTVVGGTSVALGGGGAVYEVAAVSSGVVTAIRVRNSGAYTVDPSTTGVSTTTNGSGVGCTLNLTMSAARWTVQKYETVDTTQKQLWLQGNGGGSDAIVVGAKSFVTTGTDGFTPTYGVGMVMAGSYNAGLAWHNQPQMSPGFNSSTGAVNLTTTGGAFIPMKTTDGLPMTYWISVTSRRICGIVLVPSASTSFYMSFYAGWLNQFGAATTQPYPAYVAGSSARAARMFNTTSEGFITGLTEAVGNSSHTGPAFIFYDGGWQEVKNSSIGGTDVSPSITASNFRVVYPVGTPDEQLLDNAELIADYVDDSMSFVDIAPVVLSGAATRRIQPTAGQDLMIRATILTSTGGSHDIVGELDGVVWIPGDGQTSQNTVTDTNGDRYRVAQNGNRVRTWSFMALKES